MRVHAFRQIRNDRFGQMCGDILGHQSFLDSNSAVFHTVFWRATPTTEDGFASEHRAREQEKAPRVTPVGLFVLMNDRLKNIRHFALDLDGTLYLGGRLFEAT